MESLRGEIKALVVEVRKVQGYRFAKPLYSAIAASLALGAIVVLDKAAREVLVQIEGELKEHQETKGVALVNKIKNASLLTLAVAAKRLLGGDIVVTFKSKIARKRQETINTIKKVFKLEAKIKYKNYSVVVPYIPLRNISSL